jgi:hypothetical protein
MCFGRNVLMMAQLLHSEAPSASKDILDAFKEKQQKLLCLLSSLSAPFFIPIRPRLDVSVEAVSLSSFEKVTHSNTPLLHRPPHHESTFHETVFVEPRLFVTVVPLMNAGSLCE